MRNLSLTLLGAMIAVSGAYAQTGSNAIPVKHLQKNNFSSPVKGDNKAQAKDFDNPLWESDFSDPSMWEIGNEVGNEDNWVIGTEGPAGPDFGIDPIESTTADNGFALFDSDVLCSGDQNAWIGNADPINLLDEPFVSIRFETFYRDFQGSCFIETSTDGTTWGNTVEILDLDVNASTANPVVLQLPLNGIGGSSTAYFRFRYEGGCDYAWMIDDVAIAATPEFDVALTNADYDNWLEISNSIPGDPTPAEDLELVRAYEYNMYMQNQVRPFTFYAEVENLGAAMSTGITLVVNVTTPGGEESYTSESVDLEVGASDTITIENIMLGAFDGDASLGTYTVDFEIISNEADENISNNTVDSKSFMVTDQTMSNTLTNNYTGSYALGQDVIWGNRIAFVEDQQINFIEFAVLNSANSPSQPGEVIYPNVRSGSVFSPSENNELVTWFEEDEIEYVIEESDFTTPEGVTYITVFLPETITLEANRVHQGEVYLPPGSENYAFIPVGNSQEDIAGSLYEFADPSGGPQGWWSLGANAPLIRLGFDGTIGTENNGGLQMRMSQNYPNPSMGTTRIDWELMEAANNVQFTITDITGKIVYSRDLGDRPAGIQEPLELNLNLPAGNYQYGLQIGNRRLVRKMVIVK